MGPGAGLVLRISKLQKGTVYPGQETSGKIQQNGNDKKRNQSEDHNGGLQNYRAGTGDSHRAPQAAAPEPGSDWDRGRPTFTLALLRQASEGHRP